MKWNLRWAAAQRDIWRPTQLLAAFQEAGFSPSLSKVAALWSGKPISVRLDDLDKICTALDCTVADLMVAEPVEKTGAVPEEPVRVVGGGAVRPLPRSGGGRRSMPPN
ncbi:helix-turn-helix domain-containing protein [Kitasatospora sp. NPDC101155]|uniref:helix-turn-helix domain-containing protein n=1 Tax=Kitasatospora sp. NPDC101155 TaxID=3364097 RepID=UPI0038220D3D